MQISENLKLQVNSQISRTLTWGIFWSTDRWAQLGLTQKGIGPQGSLKGGPSDGWTWSLIPWGMWTPQSTIPRQSGIRNSQFLSCFWTRFWVGFFSSNYILTVLLEMWNALEWISRTKIWISNFLNTVVCRQWWNCYSNFTVIRINSVPDTQSDLQTGIGMICH